MKALIYTDTQRLDLGDVAAPTPDPGQAIVDIAYCGICGSDMHAWHGHDERRVPPLVLGHEISGTARDGKHKGKLVAINPLTTCGTCATCQSGRTHLCEKRELLGMRRHGGFTESVAINETNITPLPPSLDLATAALAEPLACAVHTVGLFGKETPTGAMTIIGAGAIGLLCALVAAVRGFVPIQVLDTNAGRRQAIDALANPAITSSDPIASPPTDNAAPYIIDAVGSGKTRALATAHIKAGGILVHIGLQDNAAGLDTRRLTLQEITFIGSYCYTPADFATAITMLADRAITDGAWTQIRPLADGATAFQDIHNGKAVPKIILNIKG